MTADRWSDLVALLAGVVGLFVLLRTWPRAPRRAQVARLRHPSAPLPVGVALDTSGENAHWRVSTSAASVPTSVDIVTWRPTGSADWRSEPIVEPLVLEPGASVTLPLVVDDPTSPHLVVVAWTVRHPGGDVQGSRTLTIGTTSSALPAPAPPNRSWAPIVAAALVAGLLVVLVIVAGWRVLEGDDDRASSPIDTTAPITETEQVIHTPTDPTAAPPAATPGTRPGSTTSVGTEPASTTISTVTATVTATVASTTAPPGTTTTSSPAATDPDGRTIEVDGRVEDCDFGADCVIVSFAAVGFPDQGDYVCEFADGSRITFRYAGGGALDACAASGEQPSITIEIDGVRSPTVTRETPQGA